MPRKTTSELSLPLSVSVSAVRSITSASFFFFLAFPEPLGPPPRRRLAGPELPPLVETEAEVCVFDLASIPALCCAAAASGIEARSGLAAGFEGFAAAVGDVSVETSVIDGADSAEGSAADGAAIGAASSAVASSASAAALLSSSL